MKRLIAILLVLLVMLPFAGCNSAKIEVGVKAGVAYFRQSKSTPEVILNGESAIEIKDASFFGKLRTAIDGKSAVNDVCNCEAIYNVKIDKYHFGLHTHGITITWPMGHNIKGVNIFTVECTEEEMNELFGILESVN